MIIELKHIYKDYVNDRMVTPVLKDINLTVEKGDYLAIMGPSGSGKTTLMNIIGCLDTPTSGEYVLDGTEVSDKSTDEVLSDLRLKKLGFVFQTFNLLSNTSSMENVELPLIYAGVPKAERKRRAAEALKRMGLDDKTSNNPGELSGGQKQRVAIARAIINDPAILLADEPTGALDSASGEAVMELFKELNDEGVTVIMITHDAGIAAHAKHIVYLKDGRIESRGGDADE
ncbi:MAG: ABC transporter ATP-binding protein [Lachnospiraceae bacterium]|nr:ABC transporter ATP-binding protein [Lachnospiraceae bacterium]